MASSDHKSAPLTNIVERTPSLPIRPRVLHIVSPLTGSKATIITTDTVTTTNHGPVLIQAAPRINRTGTNQLSNPRKRIYPFTQESETTAYLSAIAANRNRERLSKGLRYFSKKVCNKVQNKKITSYNEVATELVNEYTLQEKRNLRLSENELAYEQKNIRRRVYDAINVLLAMNIIVKDKKDIRWIGFPVNALFECEIIEKKVQEMKENIQVKMQQVEQALKKQVALQNLISRNKHRTERVPLNRVCFLPFVVLGTFNGVNIRSAFSKDGRDTIIAFDRRTNVNNETECLNRIGLSKELQGHAQSDEEVENCCSLFPPTFSQLVKQMAVHGKLQALFQSKTVTEIKTRKQTKSVPYASSSHFEANDDQHQVEDDDDDADDDDEDDVLSISSADENEESNTTSAARH